jgi:hypothetical protein
MKRVIPKNKISDMRLGQLIWNAMAHAYGHDDEMVGHRLFFVENDELEKMVQDFLKYYKSPPKGNAKTGK